MNQNRRNFLKFVGLSAAAGLCFGPVRSLMASGGGGAAGQAPVLTAGGLKAKRWAMVVDTRVLNSAETIKPLMDVCHSLHNVPNIPNNKDIKWVWGAPFHEAFTDMNTNYLAEGVESRQFLLLCNHCENPPCVRVCPTKATYQRPDGIVTMDYHRCIGCRYCMAGCPYGSRSFNFGEPRDNLDLTKLNKEYPTRMRGVVEKCTFCVERLEAGKVPACVEASKGALLFGDLAAAGSEVRKALRENFTIRRKPSLGTEPSVYYIL